MDGNKPEPKDKNVRISARVLQTVSHTPGKGDHGNHSRSQEIGLIMSLHSVTGA